jgi:histidinol-phosphate aminotransferase
MRLGYAVAPADMIAQMRPYSMGSINALVKWGGVASLKDEAGQAKIKKMVADLREKTSNDLRAYGYDVIPSQTNFFMVSIGREIQPVIDEFRQRKVLVGRPFPPMTTHMRVSIGTAEEMDRFTKAFKEIFPAKSAVKTTAVA